MNCIKEHAGRFQTHELLLCGCPKKVAALCIVKVKKLRVSDFGLFVVSMYRCVSTTIYEFLLSYGRLAAIQQLLNSDIFTESTTKIIKIRDAVVWSMLVLYVLVFF